MSLYANGRTHQVSRTSDGQVEWRLHLTEGTKANFHEGSISWDPIVVRFGVDEAVRLAAYVLAVALDFAALIEPQREAADG